MSEGAVKELIERQSIVSDDDDRLVAAMREISDFMVDTRKRLDEQDNWIKALEKVMAGYEEKAYPIPQKQHCDDCDIYGRYGAADLSSPCMRCEKFSQFRPKQPPTEQPKPTEKDNTIWCVDCTKNSSCKNYSNEPLFPDDCHDYEPKPTEQGDDLADRCEMAATYLVSDKDAEDVLNDAAKALRIFRQQRDELQAQNETLVTRNAAMTDANEKLQKQNADLAAKLKELECQLSAWHSVFQTSQLSHAQSRLEEAEKKAAKLDEAMKEAGKTADGVAEMRRLFDERGAKLEKLQVEYEELHRMYEDKVTGGGK